MNSLRLIILLTGILCFDSSCREKTEYSKFSGFAQGTTYSMIFENPRRFNVAAIQDEVEQILTGFDLSLSLYVDSSVLCRINRNETDIPDEYFTEVFRRSKEISALTGGAFDVTVGPLVRAWGFGPDAHKNFRETDRDSLMQLVGIEKVDIRNGRILKADPRISLDFNAIAKGYSVDVISRFFDRKGIKSYLVEIGGEIRARGDRGGVFWKIGIDKPADSNVVPGQDLQAIISMKDRSLATSGNYRRFYMEDGVKYSHTIDPKTGYPSKNRLLSATILASDCMTADGIATACMVMGKERAIEFIERNPEFDAFLIYSDDQGNYRTWISEKLIQYIDQSR
ncbi:MAG TPA: FAD:protein FMN transferase [Bacteroidales bacterium]|jgi:thiamine biosynthesis lipoprotein|nr:FAD:protein FMN transferase [Bacteroidales bacterium]HQH22805.1 FAD:protein FMN transferase [Bacteroidales bacterium]HQJ81729.1 FAD:protein FMN transferase [Bacteroidales bacterium]